MITIMILIKKKPELTMTEFIDYYETRHAPLANEIFPMYAKYIRHYIEPDEWHGASIDYSVITELGFATEEDYRRFGEIAADPEVQARIKADEANFLISKDVRMLRVRSYSD